MLVKFDAFDANGERYAPLLEPLRPEFVFDFPLPAPSLSSRNVGRFD